MSVDAQRKYAYRYLLYWAMIEIRSLQWLGHRGIRAWNPLYWRRQAKWIRQAGAIADWLHNLAVYSAADFNGFDESRFWEDYSAFQARYPEFQLERYRDMFEQRVSLKQQEQ